MVIIKINSEIILQCYSYNDFVVRVHVNIRTQFPDNIISFTLYNNVKHYESSLAPEARTKKYAPDAIQPKPWAEAASAASW